MSNTIGSLLDNAFAKHVRARQSAALLDLETGITHAYDAVDRASERVATKLGHNQVVAMSVESALLAPVMAGVLRAGAILVPIDLHQPLALVRHFLEDAGANVLVVEEAWQERARAVSGASIKLLVVSAANLWDPAVENLCESDAAIVMTETNSCPTCASTATADAKSTISNTTKNSNSSTSPGTARLAANALARALLTTTLAEESSSISSSDEKSDTISHIIYTSGSTGLPKGVMGTHKGLMAYVAGKNASHAITSDARVMLTSTPIWDPCLGDVVSTFCAGACLCIAPRGRLLQDLGGCLCEAAATHVLATPSLWSLLKPADAIKLPALEVVVLGGEPMSVALRKAWQDRVRLFNTYGVTEATVYQTIHECSSEDKSLSIIGRALPDVELELVVVSRRLPLSGSLDDSTAILGQTNTQIRLSAAQGEAAAADGCGRGTVTYRLAMPGEEGEIWLGGTQVAHGYSQAADAAALCAFVEVAPWRADDSGTPVRSVTGGADRWFRTGDMARRLPSGQIELLGRLDTQVKLRGIRLELGAVEAALHACPIANEAAVVMASDPQRLVAFVAPSVEAEGADFDAELRPLFRLACTVALPAHAVPVQYVEMVALPRLPNGKLHRNALVAPVLTARGTAAVPPKTSVIGASTISTGTAATASTPGPPGQESELHVSEVALRGEVEHAVARAWGAVLEGIRGHLGPYDRFWDLGGTSVTAVSMLAILQRELDAITAKGGPAFPDDARTRMCGLHRKPRLRDFAIFVEWAAMSAPNALPGSGTRLGAWLGVTSVPQSAEQVLADFEHASLTSRATGAANADAAAPASTTAPQCSKDGESASDRLDDEAVTALMLAARGGRCAVVAELLALGVPVDGRFSRLERTSSPLMVAAQAGHVEVVKTLLAAGAAPNASSRSHTTAAHLAACTTEAGAASTECLRLLLDAGAAAVARDFNKWTCVTYAAWHGHIPCLELLISRGAPLDTKDRWSQLPVSWAAYRGHAAAVEALLAAGAPILPRFEGKRSRPQRSHVNRTHDKWLPPLHMALEGARINGDKDFACLRALLRAGTPIDLADGAGRTALHMAAGVSATHTLSATPGWPDPENGMQPSAQVATAQTELVALEASDEVGDQEVWAQGARLLLECGASPHVCDNGGETPLGTALRCGNAAVARILRAASM